MRMYVCGTDVVILKLVVSVGYVCAIWICVYGAEMCAC